MEKEEEEKDEKIDEREEEEEDEDAEEERGGKIRRGNRESRPQFDPMILFFLSLNRG